MNKETIHIENLSIGYPGKGDVKVVAMKATPRR